MDLMEEINRNNSMFDGSNQSAFLDEFMINFLDGNNNNSNNNNHTDILSDSSSYNLNDSGSGLQTINNHHHHHHINNYHHLGNHNNNNNNINIKNIDINSNGGSNNNSYPSSPMTNNSSSLDNCSSSPETPFDFPTSVQYNEFLNSFPPTVIVQENDQSVSSMNTTMVPVSPFTGILEQQPPPVLSIPTGSTLSSPLSSSSHKEYSSSPVSSSSPSSSSSFMDAQSDEKKSKKRLLLEQNRVQNIVHPLTREELLKLTGKEPVKVFDQPTHSLEDERTVKKQRRLIKNRESAQLSRMRKKIYIEDLEKKISDLTNDNNSLKEEVIYLQGLVKQLASGDNQPQQQQLLSTTNLQNKKNIKAAGVCLLIIFFSFGVFFQNQQSSSSTSSPFSSSSTTSLSYPAGVSTNERTTHSLLSLSENSNDSNTQTNNINQNRNIVNNNNNNNNNNIIDSLSTSSDSITILNTNNKRSLSDDSRGNSHKKRIKITNLEEEDDDSDIEVIQRQATPIRGGVPSIVHANNNEQRPQLSDQQPQSHSSYIICSDSARIVSSNLTQTTESMLNSNSSSPLTIGLVLPANSLDLDSTNVGGNLHPERSIIEISCQVSNIRLWNYNGPSPLEQNRDFENSIVISTL